MSPSSNERRFISVEGTHKRAFHTIFVNWETLTLSMLYVTYCYMVDYNGLFLERSRWLRLQFSEELFVHIFRTDWINMPQIIHFLLRDNQKENQK